MKKATFLIVLLAFLSSWYGAAQITSYPYSEDFEAGAGGWVATNGSNGTWALGAPTANVINSAASGTNAWATNLSGNYNANENSFVQSPVFDLSALTAPSIQLSIWWNAEFSWDGMVLQSSIDSGTSWQNVGAFGDPNNWYNDTTINGNPGGQQIGWTGRGTANGSQGWRVARHALTGLAGQSNVILRFAFGSDGSVQDNGVAFDLVSVFEVTCPEPSALTVASQTATTANITWSPGGSETAWEVVAQPAGTGVPTGSGTPTTLNNPYVAMGLSPATNYEVYVRSACGSEFSPWVGPINFLTECTSFTAPYTQGFENAGTIPVCWTMSGGEVWRFSNTGAGNHIGDNGTITGNTATNGYFAWVDSSGTDAPATLLSPLVDVSTLTTPALSFYELSNNEGNANSTLTVDVWDGAAWNNVGVYNTNTSGWELKVIDLSTLTITGNVQARFIFSETTPGDFYDDIAIDDVRFDEAPTCFIPTNLTVVSQTATTANITWSPGASETAWEVAVQPAGTGTPTGSGDPTTLNNPYIATGLNPATSYEVYVRSSCGGTFSPWTGPINFLTECVSFTAPYTEGFENAGTIPICWTMSGGEVWRFSNTGAGNHIGNNGTITGTTATNGYFAWVDSSGSDAPATLLSPLVDVSALTVPALSFYEISNNEGNDNSTLTVDVWDGAAWNNVGIYNTNTAGWELKIIDLSGLTITGDVQVRFIFSETTSSDFYDDIAIDDVTIDEAPACIIPAGLTATNISGTTADISWSAGTATAWEYVIQPAGTGVPSGNGTALTVNTVNETGLAYSTSYEVYIRTDCGPDGFSDWVGPLNFTTTIQTNFTVDCNAGPVNSVTCYNSNDGAGEVITFTSSDGVTALNIVFNSGNVENNWDELIVLDSDGTTNLNPNPYGAGGNVAGLTFQSTGPTISFYVDADGSVSCQSSSNINPLDVTVTCATCINPSATYTVIDDCANGSQFLIDVNITSIGDAASLTVTDNQGSAGVQVTATGTVQMGPYPFATPIVITISNDQDVNCVINSNPIQVAACPPANDNCAGATVAAVNPGATCDVTTPGTVLAATPSGVPAGSCTGNPDDDVWFQFTALNEVQLISLINITGGTTNLDHAVYSGACGALTELYCSQNTASVTPLLTVGTTYYVRVFSGGSVPESSTFDLCIQKAPDNTICEQAANFCSAGGSSTGSNIIGFPSTGPIACLGSNPNPSWNIIQVGDPGLIEIQIVQTSSVTGNGIDVDFVLWGPFDTSTDYCSLGLEVDCPTCPNNTSNPNFYPFGNIVDCSYSASSVENLTIDNALSGEIYLLLVTNFSNQPGSIAITQTNSGTAGAGSTVASIQVSLGGDQDLCGIDSIVLSADSPFADSYEWYADGFVIDGETSSTLTVTESNTYTVIAYDSQCDVTAQDTATITLGLEPVANPAPDLVTCDDVSGDGFEEFDLESQTATILGTQDPALFNVTYHLTQSDAITNTGALTSPYTNVTNPQTIWVRVEDANAPNCIATTNFNLVISGVAPTVNPSPDLIGCDTDDNDSAEYDLTENEAVITGGSSGVTVTYHTSMADADAGTGAIGNPTNYETSLTTIYVRVEDTPSGCYSVTSFNLVAGVLPSTTFATDFDYEVCPNATVPIIITATAQNYSLSDVSVVWYQDGGVISGQNGLTIPVLTEGYYEIQVTFIETGCTEVVGQQVIELDNCIIPQGISPDGDGKNDTFDLSNFNVTRIEIFNRLGTLVYSKDNYTNEWRGQSNSGDELPVGTYFYTMVYEGGAKQLSAWVYINK